MQFQSIGSSGVHNFEGLLEGLQHHQGVLGEQPEAQLEVVPDFEQFLVLVGVDALLAALLESALLDDGVLPGLGGVGLALEEEEVVGGEEVEVAEEDGDGLHDVPGEVEVDEVVQHRQLAHQEGGEEPHPALRPLLQALLDHPDVLLQQRDLALHHLQQLLEAHLLQLQLVAVVHHVLHHVVVQRAPLDELAALQLAQGLADDGLEDVGAASAGVGGRAGGAEEGLVGVDVVEVAIDLEEEALVEDAEERRARVVGVVVHVVEGAQPVLLEDLEVGQEGVSRQLHPLPAQQHVRHALHASQLRHVLHLPPQLVQVAPLHRHPPAQHTTHPHYSIINMHPRDRPRIYSQEPHRFAQRGKSRAEKELFLVRMSSFQDEPTPIPEKLATTAKNSHKSPYESEGNKERAQENIEQRKSKHQSAKEEKGKGLGMGALRKESQKQRLAFFGERESEAVEVRLEGKGRRRKEGRRLVYFTKGNNHPLLKEVFLGFNFAETQAREHAHICWLQSSSQKTGGFHSSKSLYQEHLPEIGKGREGGVVYNYLQGQSELTNKERLYRNMKKSYPESIGNYIPTSFIIDFRQEQAQVEQSLLEFVAYYLKRETRAPKSRAISIRNYFMEISISNKQINRLLEKAQGERGEEGEGEGEGEGEPTLWIFKPASLNRGRGIHLFSSLKQLSRLLSENSFEISVKVYNDNMSPKSYILQEYIERPLLIDGYKFDIRMWVMLQVLKANGKKTLKAYLFREGYARLASMKYGVEREEGKEGEGSPKREKRAYISNKFIHLTNNAVQKQARDYGQFCEGNQLSLPDALLHLQKQDPLCPITLASTLQAMRHVVLQSVGSVRERLVASNSPKTFQLLGYDFLLDWQYRLWLIEVNCNPCLEESSQLLGRLLRTMLRGLVVLSELEEPRSEGAAEQWEEVV